MKIDKDNRLCGNKEWYIEKIGQLRRSDLTLMDNGVFTFGHWAFYFCPLAFCNLVRAIINKEMKKMNDYNYDKMV